MCILGVFIFENSLFLYYSLFVWVVVCICFVPYIVPPCVPPFLMFDILSKIQMCIFGGICLFSNPY